MASKKENSVVVEIPEVEFKRTVIKLKGGHTISNSADCRCCAGARKQNARYGSRDCECI